VHRQLERVEAELYLGIQQDDIVQLREYLCQVWALLLLLVPRQSPCGSMTWTFTSLPCFSTRLLIRFIRKTVFPVPEAPTTYPWWRTSSRPSCILFSKSSVLPTQIQSSRRELLCSLKRGSLVSSKG